MRTGATREGAKPDAVDAIRAKQVAVANILDLICAFCFLQSDATITYHGCNDTVLEIVRYWKHRNPIVRIAIAVAVPYLSRSNHNKQTSTCTCCRA